MKLRMFNLMLVAAAFVVSLVFYERMPNLVPMHWNIRGEVDSYQAKQTAVWTIPAMIFLMWILFQVMPKLDPKKEKYAQFRPEWQTLQTLLIGFFVYIHLITVYIALNPTAEMMPLMFSGMGVMFMVMGNLLPKIRQNFFVGIKVPWTLSDEENWNKTHRLGGWSFVLSGMMMVVQAIRPILPTELIFAFMMVLMIVPIFYSYWLYRQKRASEV